MALLAGALREPTLGPVMNQSSASESGSQPLPDLPPRARIVQVVRDWIESGELQPGARLPAEQTLAASLSVARGTVRQALAELVDLGLLEKQLHRGHVVSAQVTTGSSLMARTCLLLGELVEQREPVPGFDEAVVSGAAAALAGAVFNRLSLHPNMLDVDEGRRIAMERPAGVIACHYASSTERGRAFVDVLAAAGVPCVVNGGNAWCEGYDRAVSDQEQGGYRLTRLLIERGRRHFVLLSTAADEPYWLIERERGIRRALDEAGLPPITVVPMQVAPRSDTEDLANLDQRTRTYAGHLVEHCQGKDAADAVMVLSDSDCAPVTAGLRLCGLDPASQVDVVGYDHYWNNDAMWERRHESVPPLATVDKRNTAVGRALVELLMNRVEGEVSDDTPRVRWIEPELVQLR
ncbi:MAG: GntR family transcriptional regulator [Planctomycetota bacterium]|jgi:DNA-binding LacI/PurR family transcriptional regulator|nr:GntR family transcriptional regulator [Planctomycetota bacterium]